MAAAGPSVVLQRVPSPAIGAGKVCLVDQSYTGRRFSSQVTAAQQKTIEKVFAAAKAVLIDRAEVRDVLEAGGRIGIEFLPGQYKDIWYVKNAQGDRVAAAGSGYLHVLLSEDDNAELRACKAGIASLQEGHVRAPLRAPEEPFFRGLFGGFHIPNDYKNGDVGQVRDAIEKCRVLIQDLKGKIAQKYIDQLIQKHVSYAIRRAIRFIVQKTPSQEAFKALKVECGVAETDKTHDDYFHDIVCLSIQDPYEQRQYMLEHKLPIKEMTLARFLVEKALKDATAEALIREAKDKGNVLSSIILSS